MCLSPLTLKIEKSGNYEDVPCGKCMKCLATKRHDWSVRLEQELKVSKTAKFVTITYDEEHLPKGDYGLNTLVKRDMQLFMKLLRKTQKTKIRYFLVGEYGSKTFRPHYHAIIFNLVGTDPIVLEKLLKSWKKGQIHVGKVTVASIKYTTKYMLQMDQDFHGIEKPFALMSRNPGIGANYLDVMQNYHKNDRMRNYYPGVNGTKNKLPRYYRDKLYGSHTRKMQNVETAKRLDEKFKKEVLINNGCVSTTVILDSQRKQDFVRRQKAALKNSKL